MPHELDRIKHLAGLQQEAAVSLKGKESALKAWYNKYSKYTGGNGDPLPFGLIKAYTESGIISDGYEENELAKAEKALGKKEMDWEDQDWQKVYSMTPITQGMEKDLLAITGSKTIDEELLAKVYDVIEDMYPSYSDLLGKKESAVAEAPSGDKQLAQELAKYFQDRADSYPKRQHGDQEHEEMTSIADAFRTQGLQAGMDDINTSRFEFSSNPFNQDDFGEIDDNMMMLLKKHGVSAKMKGDLTYLTKGGKRITNPVADPYSEGAQESISQVDESIKKARAQIETLEAALKEDYKKFQGLKPYKPKKK